MEENTNKFEIKIDPFDFYPGLKDKMDEFESLIRMNNPGKKLAEKIEKDLKSRFCHCCFFGRVEGVLMGEPLCKECAKILYGFDADEERTSINKIDPYYQLWYRRQMALPVFEAFLHTEVDRYELEKKLAEERKHTANINKFIGMVFEELEKAEGKHPKFCDEVIPPGFDFSEEEKRWKKLNDEAEKHYAADIFNEEFYEALNAYQQGDKEHALQELAQCGAVILRIMETIEKEMEK